MASIITIAFPYPHFPRNFVITASALAIGFLGFLPVVFLTAPSHDVAYFAISAYILFSVLALFRPLEIYLRGYRILGLAKPITVSSGYFYVPSPIPADYGYFTVVRRAEGLNRSFSIQRAASLSSHPLLPEAHLLVADAQGNGKIMLPGYRLSGKYDGVVVLFFVPLYAVEFEKQRLVVQSANDIAEVFIQPTDFGFQGYLRSSLSRGVGADVYIGWTGSDVVQFLAVSGQNERFIYPQIQDAVIIVAHEEYITPENIVRALGRDVIVQGTGSFFLVLRVRFPFESEAYDSTRVWISSRAGGLS